MQHLRTTQESTTVTFAEDTAVLATDSDPAIASQKLQSNVAIIQGKIVFLQILLYSTGSL
jgi:hypothetical protein